MKSLLTYILRRMFSAVPVIIGVSILVFLMLHLVPGDPVRAMLFEVGGTEEDIQRVREQLGLHLPLPQQYMNFAKKALRGDLGRSMWWERDVSQLIASQFPSTLELAVASLLIAIGIGVPLGVLAAVHRQTIFDTACMFLALLGVSMPGFWRGLLMILLFGLYLGLFPTHGQGTLSHLVMPAFAMGVGSAGSLARLTRSAMLEILREDYIRTARAKGLSERVVVYKHALRNALIPLITVIGLQFGYLLGGTVIMETVFARQGIGRLAVQGVLSRDFPLAQGTILMIAVVFVTINLAIDLVYGVVNPRIRQQ